MMTRTEAFNQPPELFSTRKRFNQKLGKTLFGLKNWEKNKILDLKDFRLSSLPDSEQKLFTELLDFDYSKNTLSKEKSYPGKMIGFLGPLGVGKSTIFEEFIKKTKEAGQEIFINHEPHEDNPFWRLSQQNPDYMLRSQLFFLLKNIGSDLEARKKPGIAISDTSLINDIEIWVDWYKELGYLSKEEYKMYHQTVKLLKPIIPRPDLLVVMIPDSLENLQEGVRRRYGDQSQRTQEENLVPYLDIQIENVKDLVKILALKWQTKILPITVNPIAVFEDPSVRQEIVNKI